MTASNPCCECDTKDPRKGADLKDPNRFCKSCGLPIKETPAAVDKKPYSTFHITDEGFEMIAPQPAKEWWEESFKELTSSMDGQYRPKLRLLIGEVAAQSEKKGREAAVNTLRNLYPPLKADDNDTILSITADAWVRNLEAARSSEEGKTGV